MDELRTWLLESPLRFFQGILLLALIIFIPIDLYWLTVDDRKSLWLEAHSLLFDVLVFGIILTVYDAVKYRRDQAQQRAQARQWRVEHLQYEIDDYRDWDERAAMLRNAGNIRRLNREGIFRINLHNCYLRQAHLLDADLRGANLREADFREADLWRVNLQEAKAIGADFEGANFWGADLRKADLWKANLRNADLRDANLQGANLRDAELAGAKVYRPDWIGQLADWQVEGADAIAGRYHLEEIPEAFNTFTLHEKPPDENTGQ